jgi:hypothetical protein
MTYRRYVSHGVSGRRSAVAGGPLATAGVLFRVVQDYDLNVARGADASPGRWNEGFSRKSQQIPRRVVVGKKKRIRARSVAVEIIKRDFRFNIFW